MAGPGLGRAAAPQTARRAGPGARLLPRGRSRVPALLSPAARPWEPVTVLRSSAARRAGSPLSKMGARTTSRIRNFKGALPSCLAAEDGGRERREVSGKCGRKGRKDPHTSLGIPDATRSLGRRCRLRVTCHPNRTSPQATASSLERKPENSFTTRKISYSGWPGTARPWGPGQTKPTHAASLRTESHDPGLGTTTGLRLRLIRPQPAPSPLGQSQASPWAPTLRRWRVAECVTRCSSLSPGISAHPGRWPPGGTNASSTC